jgi:hypothetical protein
VLEVKFVAPITRLAASNVENGAVYSRTLSLSLSPTQRLPLESNARPLGVFSPVEVVTVLLFVKVFCPITSLAASWVTSGVAYSRTRCPSATQRSPLESKATELGAFSPALVTSSLDTVKLPAPITSVAASWVENGAMYSRTLPLRRSATQRLPLESNARPEGLLSDEEFVTVLSLAVKLDWPITRLAASPVESGALYSRTLLLDESETQRLPLEPNARPVGALRPVAVVAEASDVKLDWPITTLAASWVESGALYSRILLAPSSTTQRLWLESNARSYGLTIAVEVAPGLNAVRFGSPITMLAAWPSVKPAAKA